MAVKSKKTVVETAKTTSKKAVKTVAKTEASAKKEMPAKIAKSTSVKAGAETAESAKSAATSTPSKKNATVTSISSTPAVVATVGKVMPKTKDFTGIGYLGIPPYQEKSGEEYMNVEQRSHFKQILESWKVSLMEEVDRTVSHMKDDAANFPDLNDRASQEEEFSLELRARDRERKLIRKIDEALQRLEDDDYGFCNACGIEIGIRRLEARPTATLCIDCKTLEEIREKQLHGG